MKKKSLILVGIIILMFFSGPGIVPGQTIFDEKRIPIVQELNLLLNGTTPILVNTTSNFLWIARIVWMLDFDDATLLFTNFGGGTALANGIDVLHETSSILGGDMITQNHEFGHVSYDLAIFSDEAGTKNRMLLSRWSFFKFLPPYGIRFVNNESLQFKIQDDLTAAALDINDFSVFVQGWRSETVVSENSDESEFILIDIINWWGMFLYQNIFILIAGIAVIIIAYKMLTD